MDRVIFTRTESDHCKRLYLDGYKVYQIKKMYYEHYTILGLIVVIHVSIMDCWYEDLNRLIFNRRAVILDNWCIGQPINMPPGWIWLYCGQYKDKSRK